MRPEQPDTLVSKAELPVAPLVCRHRRLCDSTEIAREAVRLQRFVRATLVAVAVVLTAVFVCAFRIHPYDEDGNPRTMSTHTQLGMPPCSFVILSGKPCPSCGMTTSFALLVRGDVRASMRANWVGSLLCALWAATLVWAVVSAVWGQMLLIPPGRGELVFTIIVAVVLSLMLVRWGVILIYG